ncbi:hypothetical protein DH2020_036187 [Rehmannia glutinosa]|uniref:Retrotransposon Copia-like N-terminal domain-containing protein n=1 Tax=Rehmannia glutinosa TaxID=99300 RepID=A0ABR0V7T1_REHGL
MATTETQTTLPQLIYPQSQLVTIKLSESNYLVWKHQISGAIEGYGLESFINGVCSKPHQYITKNDKQIVNHEFVNWKRHDQLLASWILSSLSEAILVTLVGLTSFQDIWEALEMSFATQSRAKIMQHRLQLQTLKKRDMPMREFLNKIKTCCDMLAAAGQKLSDEEQISYILTGLGNDYNSVMVSVNSRIEPYSLREVHALLLSFESRLEGMDMSQNQFGMDGSSPMVNSAVQGGGNRKGSFNQTSRGRGLNPLYANRGGMTYFRGGPNAPLSPMFHRLCLHHCEKEV